MSIAVFMIAFYAVVFAVLVIGITLGAPSWLIAVVAFVLLFSLGMGFAYRAARSGAGPAPSKD